MIVGEFEDAATGLEVGKVLGDEEILSVGEVVIPVDGLMDNEPVGAEDKFLLGALEIFEVEGEAVGESEDESVGVGVGNIDEVKLGTEEG